MGQRQKRLELNQKFKEILGNDNVYFQPPESIKLKYPCIIYERQRVDSDYADDMSYKREMVYNVTLIETDPDSETFEKILDLPQCYSDRFYTADNLHHGSFILYY